MEWLELKYSGWGHVSQHVTGWTLTARPLIQRRLVVLDTRRIH
jgi:hypothetical protein